MKFNEFLNSVLDKKDIKKLKDGLRQDKVIIIKGIQGPTGKSTLKNFLKEQGYEVYEEYEIVELELNQIQHNLIPHLRIEP